MINFYLKWIATAVTLSAAMSVSFHIEPLNVYLLNLGSALFLLWSIRVKEASLIIVNAGMLIIYLIGLYREFF